MPAGRIMTSRRESLRIAPFRTPARLGARSVLARPIFSAIDRAALSPSLLPASAGIGPDFPGAVEHALKAAEHGRPSDGQRPAPGPPPPASGLVDDGNDVQPEAGNGVDHAREYLPLLLRGEHVLPAGKPPPAVPCIVRMGLPVFQARRRARGRPCVDGGPGDGRQAPAVDGRSGQYAQPAVPRRAPRRRPPGIVDEQRPHGCAGGGGGVCLPWARAG